MRSWLQRTALGILLLSLLAFGGLGTGVANAADENLLPMKICLTKPQSVQVNGQDVLRCDRPRSVVPQHHDFYLLVSVADQNGFQTSVLDWWVQRWQPKKRRWVTVRQQMEDKIQPSWQYLWMLQTGLRAGRYRAFVSSDFLGTPMNAPLYHFAAWFTVR